MGDGRYVVIVVVVMEVFLVLGVNLRLVSISKIFVISISISRIATYSFVSSGHDGLSSGVVGLPPGIRLPREIHAMS